MANSKFIEPLDDLETLGENLAFFIYCMAEISAIAFNSNGRAIAEKIRSASIAWDEIARNVLFSAHHSNSNLIEAMAGLRAIIETNCKAVALYNDAAKMRNLMPLEIVDVSDFWDMQLDRWASIQCVTLSDASAIRNAIRKFVHEYETALKLENETESLTM